MIILLAVLFVLELLTFLVLFEHFSGKSRLKFYSILILNLIFSIWIWILFIRATTWKGDFDTPENVSLRMNLTGMIFAVIIPRFIVTLLHYTGRLFRLGKGGHSKILTQTGIGLAALIFTIIALSTIIGRFNFKTEEVTVKIEGLDPKLEGLKIVHLSDMHLASFHNHHKKLEKAMRRVNSYEPDLIINTGDFISYGWREFDRCDTILMKAKSRFGNLAVLGNHDMGTYFPNSSESNKVTTVIQMKELITASGYRLLDNEHIIMDIRGAEVAFIGVRTGGRFPGIEYTDPAPIMAGTDSAGLKILLIHDPNQWRKDVTDKTDIELSLAGHTHGLQIGIITKRFKWSPARRFYPEWNGLYTDGDQYLYVNRGLGSLSIPFRIWMPPEITVLTLSAE
jgi:uncharacterized protein